ncbi:uncharacterized protein ZBAI_05844 [Zygosaccharomyces bailii ISA1307]|nr:uncharacterized protein ZBAI_05844 [Zygosaccharomyces bailii ISA1307]
MGTRVTRLRSQALQCYTFMGVGKTKIVGISIELSAVKFSNMHLSVTFYYYRWNVVDVVPALPNQVPRHHPILALSNGLNRGILALSSTDIWVLLKINVLSSSLIHLG